MSDIITPYNAGILRRLDAIQKKQFIIPDDTSIIIPELYETNIYNDLLIYGELILLGDMKVI